jgi:hypothetical protein
MASEGMKTCSESAREGRYGSMRFAHLTGSERPLAVVEGDRVAALPMDGLATVDHLIAAGPDAWDAARDAATAALERGFLSQACTLEPGDLILTGTPWGVGGFRDPPVFLKPGDTVEIEVDGVGVLANNVGRNTT